MQPIRAVLYGVGRINRLMARVLLERGIDIVGAVGRSEASVGKDVGDLTGLGRRLGVVVSGDADALLARADADVAVLSTTSYLASHEEQIAACLRHGVNVVTVAEEALYPWHTAANAAARLDALAREHGVTVAGSGHTDVFLVGLPLQLTGASRQITRIAGRVRIGLEDLGPDELEGLGLGITPEVFAARFGEAPLPDAEPSFGRTALEAVAGGLGLTIGATVVGHRGVVAAEGDDSVTPGHVAGFAEWTRLSTAEGIELSLETVLARGGGDREEWAIHGDPELRLTTTSSSSSPNLTTCTQAVARIPSVLAAAPGLVTVDQLPPLRFGSPSARPRQDGNVW